MSNLILRPSTFNELAQFANMAAKSAMVPPTFRGKPEDIMLAVQMGSEVGLSPMQALQNIAVINNRPSLWGDAMLGLCRNSPRCEDVAERMEGEGDKMAAFCVVKRKGATAVVSRFSVDDAKKAGLWGKAGPWTQYPARMLQMRARGFALRDAFPDVLRGLISAEEAADTPTDAAAPYAGTTIEATPEPAEPPRRTARQFLDALEAELRKCQAWDALTAIIAREDVRKAQDAFSNGAAERLHDMIEAARERLAVAADGEMPG